jgi:hypothetical protein
MAEERGHDRLSLIVFFLRPADFKAGETRN